MKDQISKLKKKYDKKQISEVESDVDRFNSAMNSSKEKMIETLHYLETTERFKENPIYATSTFDVYLKDRFYIQHATYMNWRLAFKNFKADAIKYGPGFITSVKKDCGATKVKTVLKEIKEADKKAKRPLSREKMEVIVKKHKRSRPKKKAPVEAPVDWQAKYEKERDLRMQAERKVGEYQEQIQRLKATVLRLQAAKTAIEQAAMAFKQVDRKGSGMRPS